MRRTTAYALALLAAMSLGGCQFIPSTELDADVMSAATMAESAAANAASALAQVQSATSAINAATTSVANDANQATDREIDMKSQSSTDGKYVLSVPENWQDLQGQLDGGSIDGQFLLETGSFDEQVFLIFTAESKDDTVLNSFDDFFATLTRGITGSSMLSEVQTSNPQTISLTKSGLTGKKVTFTAVYHPDAKTNQRVSYRIYGVEDDSRYYQFCGWMTAANSAMMDDTLDTIVDSFTVKS